MSGSAEDLFARLEQLNEIGVALSREHDITRLLELILLAAKTITNADGGTLYRTSEDGRFLHFEILRTDSLHNAMGGTSGGEVSFPSLALADAQGRPNDSLVAAYAAIHKQTVNIADVYSEGSFDFSGTHIFDERTGYRSKSFLTVPMENHDGLVIGVLQLINAQSRTSGEVISFSQADQSLVESLASQAAIALSNRLLMTQMEELFESFIKMINLAIDEKSPHTAGHCQRVPELAMMLADAAHQTTRGALASFVMSERDRYELKIASMLHDCGKVTTPVHVVDKASKLQTIHDRMELIDTRFEVLRRDFEIAMLRAQLESRTRGQGPSEQAARRELEQRLLALDQDRDFLRQVNRGSAPMSQEDIQRVHQISSSYRWRHVDGVEGDFLTADEVENLTIRSGNLTHSERKVINHHIESTIKMLERLPWPEHLKNVPEFAGGHHERMDGKGYPKGLRREQMSVQARLMGIADIFEALTASDRPYKPGLTLSEAMTIMNNFKRNGHIDPDLFDLFVEEGVYRRYAERFLDPWQIDEVDPKAWS